VLGSGLTDCLRLEASLAFLAVCWVEDMDFSLFLVFTIFRVRKIGLVKVRVNFCGGDDEFG